jgi:uncharacterized protein YegP (UPF0339 family)
MWRFEIYGDAGGDLRWRLMAGDGQAVATSGDAYDSESNAKRSAERFKTMAPAWLYEVYAGKVGDYHWRAKAGNGHTMAASQDSFDTTSDAERAAENVKFNAARAAGP